MYAMIDTRPEIIYVVNKLSQYCQNSTVRHRTTLDRMFRYMRKTIDLTLTYDGTINFTCYANAVYENDLIDRKSTYGHVLLIKNEAVTWINKKQRTIATSIIEIEYVFMCQTAKNIVWTIRWINELKFNHVCNFSVRLLENNQGSLNLIKNSEHHQRTKHIDVQYHYIREMAADDLIKISYVSIKKMIVDILTKSIISATFQDLRTRLNLIKWSNTINEQQFIQHSF